MTSILIFSESFSLEGCIFSHFVFAEMYVRPTARVVFETTERILLKFDVGGGECEGFAPTVVSRFY
jgi:hypothetical protein